MSATSLKPVIEKLESLFSSFNQKFYNGELQTPVITVSPDTTKGAYGWCTSWKAWSNLDPDSKTTDISQMSKADLDAMQNEGFYEINICAEHLARPFEQVAETLLHEMVHLYNLQIGVQDTSRNGTYHNKKFKEAAEQPPAFTKEQLVKADRWFNRRDLLNALLKDDKTYTIEQVDDLIKEYYKKPI